MKAYEIYDSSKRAQQTCAVLFHDEEAGSIHIQIAEDAQAQDLPFMLALLAEQGMREVPEKWAWRWVRERIPPEGRQNLGEILRANGIDEYDEMALLVAGAGRSSQDDFLIRPVTLKPSYEYALIDFPPPPQRKERSSLRENIGQELVSFRKRAGLTQRDLAEKTGIDQAVISKIESGKANPSLSTIEDLCEGVGVNVVFKLEERRAKN